MRLSLILRTLLVLGVGFCLWGQEPTGKDARPNEAQGLPPRAGPTDYQSQTTAGVVAIGAEFTGHSVPTVQQTLTTADFVVVEVGLFGTAGARLQISMDDFQLRINGKKTTLPSLPFGMVLQSLKDPEWVPPESPAAKSKGGLGVGGGGDRDSNNLPVVVHVPIELQRAMAQHTQKAALALGDRALPQAGLIFFEYRGKTKGINSVELIYSGPAGKATLPLAAVQ